VERRPGTVEFTQLGEEVARRGERVLAAARDLVDFARRLRLPITEFMAGASEARQIGANSC
jgi:DNA-binding transcriptional LysR family regulator